MFQVLKHSRMSVCFRAVVWTLISAFFSGVAPAQGFPAAADLFPPVLVEPALGPAVLKGIRTFPEDPFHLEFIVADGQKEDYLRLVRYFLASLTTPDADMWVNLSPYEKDRIIPEKFGQTEMGRDLLSQDYLLKQVTAKLMDPEGEVGREFWARVHREVRERYGVTDIPVASFNKVWIVPQAAEVHAQADRAFVTGARLRVMLEADRVAAAGDMAAGGAVTGEMPADLQEPVKRIVREVIVTALEKEVNEGRDFMVLRQVYQALILATWFKRHWQQGVLGRVYLNRNRTAGVDIPDKDERFRIFERYVELFRQGAYDRVREEYDPAEQQLIARKYVLGGIDLFGERMQEAYRETSGAVDDSAQAVVVDVKLNHVPASDSAQAEADRLPVVALESDGRWQYDASNRQGILLGRRLDPDGGEIVQFLTPGREAQEKEDFLRKYNELRANPFYDGIAAFLPVVGQGVVASDLGPVGLRQEMIMKGREYISIRQVSAGQLASYIATLNADTALTPLETDKKVLEFLVAVAGAARLFTAMPVMWDQEEVDWIDAVAKRLTREVLREESSLGEKFTRLKSETVTLFNPGAGNEEFSSLVHDVRMVQIFAFLSMFYRNVSIRHEAERIVKIFGIPGNHDGIDALEKYFDLQAFPDSRLRFAALQAVDIINSHHALKLLIKALFEVPLELRTQERFVRIKAVELLGKLPDVRVIPALFGALKDPDNRIFEAALRSLVRIGGEDTVMRLNKLLAQEPEKQAQAIFDDHGTEVLYTEKPQFISGYNTDNFNFQGEAHLDNARYQAMKDAIDSLNRKNEAYRKSKHIDLATVKDRRIPEFLAWLREKGLDKDILIVGGGVRDAYTGEMANDLDIGVMVPLTEEERIQFLTLTNQANERVYNYCMGKLKLLADALGADVDQFLPPVKGKKPVLWNGMEVQYTGPIRLQKEGRTVYLKRAIFDRDTRAVFLSASGASILTLGLDAEGDLYGRVNALDYFDKGFLVMAGGEDNLYIGAALRLLRIKHQYNKTILKQNYEHIRNAINRYLSGELKLPHIIARYVLIEQTRKILSSARDKQAAFDELKELGVLELIRKETNAQPRSPEDFDHIAEVLDFMGIILDLPDPGVAPAEEEAMAVEEAFAGPADDGGIPDGSANKGGIDLNMLGFIINEKGGPAAPERGAVDVKDLEAGAGLSPVIMNISPLKDVAAFLRGA